MSSVRYFTGKSFQNFYQRYCAKATAKELPRIEYQTYRRLNSLVMNIASIAPNTLNSVNFWTDDFKNEYWISVKVPYATAEKFCVPEPFYSKLYAEGVCSETGLAFDPITGEALDNTNTNYNMNKENDTMMNSMNFDFGPVTGNDVRISPFGLAIKNAQGNWVSYDPTGKNVIEVNGFVFDMKGMLFKMPVAIKDIQPGDMIIHNRVPMYVVGFDNNSTNSISVVDIRQGEQKNIIPATNMFGFNFVTKVVSMMNFGSMGAVNADQPFGNLMPLMMMSQMFGDGDGDTFFNMDGGMGKMMMFSMMMNQNNPFANMFAGFGAPVQRPAAPAMMPDED